MLIANDLMQEIRRALGSMPTEPLKLVNEAMSWLIEGASIEWLWTQRTMNLSLSSGSDFTYLPDDFAAIVGKVRRTGNYGGFAKQVSLSALDDLVSQNGSPSTAPCYVSVAYIDGNGASPSRNVLRFWPPATADAVDALKLTYAKRFNALPHDGAVVDIPPFFETLARETVRVFALGRYDEDTMDLAGRLERLISSDLFKNVVARDAQTQINLGQMTPGIATAPDTQSYLVTGDVTYSSQL